MFLEIVRSEGLSHLSYIVGDGNQAAVIDPRRDSAIYLDIAYREGARITHIFETHRNEDYVIGSKDLARCTGADIYHGGALPFEYGDAVGDGNTFELGEVLLQIIETPGHTEESISLTLMDKAFGDSAVGVFTGDALFIGDVGRTDFYPDRAEEVAGKLYDSIFNKLLPLGDQTILYPAHGAGSVCGAGMAAREFSTLGYERRHNPRLHNSTATTLSATRPANITISHPISRRWRCGINTARKPFINYPGPGR
jgi:hydroxyacylglutathione hydrolase